MQHIIISYCQFWIICVLELGCVQHLLTRVFSVAINSLLVCQCLCEVINNVSEVSLLLVVLWMGMEFEAAIHCGTQYQRPQLA